MSDAVLAPWITDELERSQPSRKLRFVQALLGVGVYCAFALPYLRRTHGSESLDPRQRCLFVCNHVSLLDTILLGGLFWRSGCYPILVLGDKSVWQTSWIKRLLSNRIAYLMDRGKFNSARLRELQAFGRACRRFNLVVFPEGTRGDGLQVGQCQPGVYYIAQEAQVPIIPVFIQNMQCVSTKAGRFHALAGLRRVEVHYGTAIPPATYLGLSREEFTGFIRQSIAGLQPTQSAAHLSPVLPPA